MASGVSYARQLRRFLRKRKSPLAPLAGFIAATEARYGLPRGLLVGIAGAESTFGTNPTVSQRIAQTKNAWGWGPWIEFPSYKVAIDTIAKGLAENYIGQGLTTPQQIGEKYAPSSAGNNPGHWAQTVSQTMSQFGGGGMSPTIPGSPAPLVLKPPKPVKIGPKTRVSEGTAYSIAAQLAQARLTGDSKYVLGAMKELYDSQRPPPSPTATEVNRMQRANELAGGAGYGTSGNFVNPLGTPFGGGSEFMTVDAEGAPGPNGQRYHAAKDWFAPAGSKVVSPVAGKIVEVKASRGRSGQVFGGVVKVQMNDGRVFVFRHVDPRKVRVGQRVKAGQVIAGVTDWTDGSPHVHLEIWKTLAGGYSLMNMLDPAEVFS